MEASQTPKLYDHPAAKTKILWWKYLGFMKAKDATKTNLDMTKATYKLHQKSYTNQGEYPSNCKCFFILE